MSRWGGRASTSARALWATKLPLPCSKCGRPVLPTQRWHVDHVIPRWAGGALGPENQWPAHGACNEGAGGKRGAQITNARRSSTVARMESERGRGIRPQW